jgi:hypothetical protein
MLYNDAFEEEGYSERTLSLHLCLHDSRSEGSRAQILVLVLEPWLWMMEVKNGQDRNFKLEYKKMKKKDRQ